MGFVIRNAWREIRNNRPFCLFYVINLSLGLIGFISVDSFKFSLEDKVVGESKQLLGADLALRARRIISNEELTLAREALPQGTKEIEAVDFFSMVAGPTGSSRLVKIIAIDQGFPFYGKFITSLAGEITGQDHSLLHDKPLVWIYPELRSQLEIDLGEELKIGEKIFRVSDLIKDETALSFQAAELAPKVFISTNFLDETKLLKEGNTAFRNHLFLLPNGHDSNALAASLSNILKSPEVRVYSHQRVGNRASRLLRYLSDFLGLVSMVALFLASLGSGYLYQGFVNQRMNDVAILVCMGSGKGTATRTYLMQLSILGIFAALPTIFICFFIIPLLSTVLSEFVPISLEASLQPKSMLLALIVAIFGGWFLALPSLWKIRLLRPAELFRESTSAGNRSLKSSLLFAIPGILAFWGICLFQSNSTKLANYFFFSLFVSVVVLYFLGIAALWVLDRFFRKSNLNLRLAARSLSRNRTSTVTGFLALGTGVLLLNIIPQFQYSLRQEIGSSGGSGKLPKLFLFDLQEDHLPRLLKMLEDQGKPLQNLTPWVRGKLISIKGQKYDELRETDREYENPRDQRRSNFRNRGFNLSYRDHLLTSEEIISGRMVSMNYDPNSSKPVEISMEHKYAESLDLSVGDQIQIEVGGVPINSQIVNLRRVKWTSFQPNFFVQMQPGVLEDAPKTFVGTLNELSDKEKEEIQNWLVREFPTVSIVDVERTGRKVLEIISQMTWALQVMAGLSILAGVIVLYSLAREKARQQRWEINLLKVLGASFADLKMQVRIEFGLLALSASVLGIALSMSTSYVLAEKVFDRVWSFHWSLPFGIVFGVLSMSLLVTEFATRRILREKPLLLLNQNS